jgi:hypothetical protein
MRDVVTLIQVAQRIGCKKNDYGDYLLALEEIQISTLHIAVYDIDGSFKVFGLQSIPAAFINRPNIEPRDIRIMFRDREMSNEINMHETSGFENPIQHWEIWEFKHTKANLTEEAMRNAKVVSYVPPRQTKLH